MITLIACGASLIFIARQLRRKTVPIKITRQRPNRRSP